MAYDNRMRIFEVVDPKTKKVKAKVRLNPRIVSFALAITLASGVGIGAAKIQDKAREKDQEIVNEYESEDKRLINSIIGKYPNILVNKEIIDHVVGADDTLLRIAERYGTTVERIKEINNRNTDTIYYKETLKVEHVTPKEELDKNIALLETYINSYIFKSEYAKIARGEVESDNNKQSTFFESLYGKSTRTDIDPNSIFGMTANAYTIFNESDKGVEAKTAYVNALNSIYGEIENRVNLNGYAKYVLSLDEYENLVTSGHVQTVIITK